MRPKVFATGLKALDELLPHEGFVRGAVHEILSPPGAGTPRFFSLLLAGAACGIAKKDDSHEREVASSAGAGAIVWCDPQGQLYPPAVAAMGIPLDRLYLLRPKNASEQIWAIAECMRCRGVSATVAAVEGLSRLEARRLQLAAERGGGVGILLRPLHAIRARPANHGNARNSRDARNMPHARNTSIYAAATRWLVSPLPGQRTAQRWSVQLIHGHGGRVGQTVILEHHRETRTIQARKADPVHSAAQLADRSPAEVSPARATA